MTGPEPLIDVAALTASVPAQLAEPLGSPGPQWVHWSRKFLEDAVRIVQNSRDAAQLDALRTQFTDYAAALVHLSGFTRDRAIADAVGVVTNTLNGGAREDGLR